MRAALIAALPCLLAFAPVETVRAGDLSLKDSVPHITTTGHAQVDVVPDDSFLRLGVSTERPAAADASSETARIASAVRDQIHAAGIEARDVKTMSAFLTAIYDEGNDPVTHTVKRMLRGYRSDVAFEIHVRDVSRVGALAQLLIEKGANRFNGISFRYTKETETRRALQSEAIKDALEEARSYTAAIGSKLGRVIQIGDDAEPQAVQADLPMRAAVAGRPESMTAIPVEPGVQTLSSDIRVVWEIVNHP